MLKTYASAWHKLNAIDIIFLSILAYCVRDSRLIMDISNIEYIENGL